MKKYIALIVLAFCIGVEIPVFSQPKVNFHFTKRDKALAQYNIAVNYAKRGDYEKAIEAFNTSIKLYPENPDAYYNLGIAYANKKDYEQSMKYYQKSLTFKPDDANVLYNIGVLHSNKNELDKAVEYFEKAIKVKPDYALAYTNLAMIYHYSGKQELYNKTLSALEKFDSNAAQKVKDLSK